MKSGIFIEHLKIYNNFIFMLYIAVEENNNIVNKYNEKITETIDKLCKNNVKLKTWNYLNQKNQTLLKKHKIIKENIINDELSQIKFFKQGNYYNVKLSQ